MTSTQTAKAHGLIQTIIGMCVDELPHTEIAAALDRLDGIVYPIQADFEKALAEAFGDAMSEDVSLATEVYGALCNREWTHDDGTVYCCTWRYAGGLVADIRGVSEDYMDFYCSGGEGQCSDRVAEALAALGWSSRPL